VHAWRADADDDATKMSTGSLRPTLGRGAEERCRGDGGCGISAASPMVRRFWATSQLLAITMVAVVAALG
jgi:hypothetical protein